MPEALIASSVVEGRTVEFTNRFDKRRVFEERGLVRID
jgi:hypothetical protein